MEKALVRWSDVRQQLSRHGKSGFRVKKKSHFFQPHNSAVHSSKAGQVSVVKQLLSKWRVTLLLLNTSLQERCTLWLLAMSSRPAAFQTGQLGFISNETVSWYYKL